ncbi:MAG: integral membrane-like protein, partial [Proteobacteria bacterium]|nr:integral membrane-like protein [Pseudomonadota bacterium]
MRRPAIVLLLVAALLIAPSLVTGVLLTHSSAHNLLWAGQFAEQFRAGVLYPRWMPDSFDGLGGPAFYFYPPLTFWLDALASLVAFDLPVPYRLGLLSLAVLWCSGLAMHAWLRTVTGRPLVALIGAIAYMAAPYHLLDHYMRGALAEFTAYAVLPLVLLSVARAAGPMLALSYAALLLAHLPTALLASVTILPAYAVFRATRLETGREARDFLWTRALGALLGVGLAALYLAPALSLQK